MREHDDALLASLGAEERAQLRALLGRVAEQQGLTPGAFTRGSGSREAVSLMDRYGRGPMTFMHEARGERSSLRAPSVGNGTSQHADRIDRLHRQDLRPHVAEAGCPQAFRDPLGAAARVLVRRASIAGWNVSAMVPRGFSTAANLASARTGSGQNM